MNREKDTASFVERCSSTTSNKIGRWGPNPSRSHPPSRAHSTYMPCFVSLVPPSLLSHSVLVQVVTLPRLLVLHRVVWVILFFCILPAPPKSCFPSHQPCLSLSIILTLLTSRAPFYALALCLTYHPTTTASKRQADGQAGMWRDVPVSLSPALHGRTCNLYLLGPLFWVP